MNKLQPVNEEEIEKAVAEQQDKSKRYDYADAEFKTLQREYNNLSETANFLVRNVLDFVADSEIDKQIFSALKLAISLKSQKVQFWGPLGLEIEFTDDDYIPLFGDILFQFIIFHNFDNEILSDIIDDFITSNNPLLSVIVLPTDYKNSSVESKNDNALHNILKCDNDKIFQYLSTKYNVIIQKANDLNSIPDFLYKHKNTNKILYFPEKYMSINAEGLFSFHNKNSIENYKKIHQHKSHAYSEIENALDSLDKIKIINPKLDLLAENVNAYNNEYMQISAKVHELESTKQAIEALTTTIQNNESEIFQKEKSLELKLIDRQNLQDKLDEMLSISNIDEEIIELDNKRDELNKEIGKIQNELISVRNELNRNNVAIEREETLQNEKAAAAKTFVPKIPTNLEYRNEPNIRKQITEIEIKIKNFDHLPASFEQYERKKAEYESHARKLKRTKKVFYELAERLDHERSLWQTQLQDYIDLMI
ncbi:MAG: hypothetical protein K8S87_11705 [Planctomycetes bacterium]|nr:hypothetical protein [Planctomycetota bacterium]